MNKVNVRIWLGVAVIEGAVSVRGDVLVEADEYQARNSASGCKVFHPLQLSDSFSARLLQVDALGTLVEALLEVLWIVAGAPGNEAERLWGQLREISRGGVKLDAMIAFTVVLESLECLHLHFYVLRLQLDIWHFERRARRVQNEPEGRPCKSRKRTAPPQQVPPHPSS